jgi:Uma2 family endonuclease
MGIAQSTLSPPSPTLASIASGRVLLFGVNWTSYERFLAAVGDRRVRLTYDRGSLEIMTLSGSHEWWKRRFGFALVLLGAVLHLRVQGYGSVTVRREDLDRGLEPDEGFYIRHAVEMRGPREFDFTRDPPPDLAIEIDISSSSLNRMSIYAALRIPEVWRFDGESLQVYRLRAEGDYQLSTRSLSFPSLPLVEFVQFLKETQQLDDAEFINPFSEWARAHALPSATNGAGNQST